MAVDQSQHVDQNHREENAVQDLREQDDGDLIAGGQQNHCQRAHPDQARIQRIERGRLVHALVDAGLEAQPFAHVVGRGERQDGGREQRGVAKPEGEQGAGSPARERTQGQRRVGAAADFRVPGRVNRGRAGDDDKKRHHVCHRAAHDDVPPSVGVVLDLDPFLDGRGLLVELHPGRNRGPHQSDNHVKVI